MQKKQKYYSILRFWPKCEYIFKNEGLRSISLTTRQPQPRLTINPKKFTLSRLCICRYSIFFTEAGYKKVQR